MQTQSLQSQEIVFESKWNSKRCFSMLFFGRFSKKIQWSCFHKIDFFTGANEVVNIKCWLLLSKCIVWTWKWSYYNESEIDGKLVKKLHFRCSITILSLSTLLTIICSVSQIENINIQPHSLCTTSVKLDRKKREKVKWKRPDVEKRNTFSLTADCWLSLFHLYAANKQNKRKLFQLLLKNEWPYTIRALLNALAFGRFMVLCIFPRQNVEWIAVFKVIMWTRELFVERKHWHYKGPDDGETKRTRMVDKNDVAKEGNERWNSAER